MARRSEPSLLDNLFELLKLTPFWVGPVLAVGAFCFLRFLIPLLIPPKPGTFDVGSLIRQMALMFSWIVGGAVLMVWLIAEVSKFFDRRLLDSQSGIASIRKIPWSEFERLVAEAYRRKGYVADVVGNCSGDGGVDIRLTRPGEKVLIQCKQWKAYTVGVKAVRELLGVVVSEKATKGVLVTSGRFTKEARRFSEDNGEIELVDGPALAELVREVQVSKSENATQRSVAAPVIAAPASPRCPMCSSEMVLRTARKGSNAGSQFWGCRKYPECRGTRPY